MRQLKMAEYCQIRDENKNCVCGICCMGILRKDVGNRYIYVYIYVNKTVPNLRILSECLKMFPGD